MMNVFFLRYLTEVERRQWWAKWTMHEMYHYLFRIYHNEFGLENTSHQWFNRSAWPEDFVGRYFIFIDQTIFCFYSRYENDYFHEALHKRLLKAETLPNWKVLQWEGIQPCAAVFSKGFNSRDRCYINQNSIF